jgi:hypothetical protein
MVIELIGIFILVWIADCWEQRRLRRTAIREGWER